LDLGEGKIFDCLIPVGVAMRRGPKGEATSSAKKRKQTKRRGVGTPREVSYPGDRARKKEDNPLGEKAEFF